MKLIFMGTPDFAVDSLRKLIQAGHEVSAVFTQPDKPKGRKQILTPPPVKEEALKHNIPVYQPASMRTGEAEDIIRSLNPEVIAVVAYGKILPESVLQIPKYGCINVHGSLLPKYRGAAPIQWSVLNGDKVTGVTTMKMDAGLDTGDMLLKEETPIGENETSGELFERLADIGADLLLKTLSGLEKGELSPEKQDDAHSVYAPMLDKSMSVIDWNKPVRTVHNQIRGLSPWPVAYTTVNGEKMKVYTSRIVREDGASVPGEIVESGKRLVVSCADGLLELSEVQYTGGKRMAAQVFLRGHKLEEGTVLL